MSSEPCKRCDGEGVVFYDTSGDRGDGYDDGGDPSCWRKCSACNGTGRVPEGFTYPASGASCCVLTSLCFVSVAVLLPCSVIFLLNHR